MTDPSFLVLLGTDYAGKSAVLRALAAAEPSWRLLSVDDEFLPPEHGVVARLKSELFREALPGMRKHYSPDFVVTLLQAAVVYLRDQIMDCGAHQPVVVDSYYYKIIAKCRLLGATEAAFDWWRGLPRPRRALFLDVDPVTAWARSASGTRTHRLEFYGDYVDRDEFIRFQHDLRTLMLAEVAPVPFDVLPETDLAGTVSWVRSAVSRVFG